MSASMDQAGDRAVPLSHLATAVLDSEGTVVRWSRAAADLLDRSSREVCGHPVRELLDDDLSCEAAPEAARHDAGIPAAGRTRLRHRSGDTIDVAFRAVPLEGSSELLVMAAPTRYVTDSEQSMAFFRGLFSQDRIGVGIHDTDLNIVRTTLRTGMFGGLPAAPPGSRLRAVLAAEDAEDVESALRHVLDTGIPLVDRPQRVRSPRVPGRQWTFSLSAFRLEDATGNPTGVATVFTDTTEQERSRRHLDLIESASKRIGTSLDLTETAQDLADTLVPAFGDLAWVEIAEAAFDGDEPPKLAGGGLWHIRRAAVAAADGNFPAPLLPPGAACPPLPDGPIMRSLQQGMAVAGGRAEHPMIHDPELTRLFVPERGHSFVSSPLFARGLVLGVAVVWRVDRPDPFDEEDKELLAEIASRAALGVDNARRYTREHRAAVALQRLLLPRATTETSAAETAGFYVPAGGGADISGDWFDVIPLPSLRTALVVGDVMGHGLHATATMGRLRTAIQTLADLELEPTELLNHLDDLVQRIAAETPGTGEAVGATCLYALYDPVSRRATLASAGHPPPIAVRPDATAEVLGLSPGPPLGVGGMPFESTTVELEPGSVLALYTNGLTEGENHDIAAGLRQLTDNLTAHCHRDDSLHETGRALLPDTADQPPRDDIALLLARTRAVPPENIASWEFPADPTHVSDARKATTDQLAAWGLDDLSFTTEMVVSELVTNAIRYAGGPVGLRLIRENVLVCEVTDPSNTQPRLRRADTTDEGGRGLFLVAQLTTRWGSRYGQHGKTIWAEQPIHPTTDDGPASSLPNGFGV
ncbi:SpoIIE family protein phosphatase [Streptomyces sp. NPDC046821]|uniref:SpoIIE family protein phosphatase n=1 Tax=Streptomyces sp. NPDC046821 TaxID=3154702 RepID=UPI0033E18A01